MGMIIDGIAASEHLDSSGEILKIDGHDISDLEEGKGVLNWEHNNDSSEDIVGHIVYAKKIMKVEEAENERQRSYWHMCKVPFVYIQAELFDDEHHPGGVAAAALIRYYHKREMKVLAGFSIEGATLDRSSNILKRSVGRRVALTLRPCNKSAVSRVLSDKAIDKEVKKFMRLDEEVTSKVFEVDTVIFSDIEKHENPLKELRMAVETLSKTLAAGSYDAPPSTLTQGSALQVENRSRGLSQSSKDRLKAILSKWDGSSPIREVIKADLPDISDDYVDHFASIMEGLELQKAEPYDSFQLSPNPNADFFQASLVEGIDLSCLAECNSKVVKTTSDICQAVLVKLPSEVTPNGAVRATQFYELAKSFFDMEGFVIPTNFIKLSGHSNALEVCDISGEVSHIGDPAFGEAIDRARENGLLHKMVLMDMITGQDSGRYWSGFLLKDGRLMLADNEKAFSFEGYKLSPIIEDDTANDHLDLRAISWTVGLDPALLVECMTRLGIDRDLISQSVSRLQSVKSLASSKNTIGQLAEKITKGGE